MAIEIKDFSVAVSEILDGYSSDVREAVAGAVEQAGKKALKTVKARSPESKKKSGAKSSENKKKSGRSYKKGWRMKAEKRGGAFHDQTRVIIYNASGGSRVHLLENGHQKASGGRVEGIPHVQPAYEEAERVLPQLTARAIAEASSK